MGARRLLQLRATEHYQRVTFDQRGRSAVGYGPSMTAHSTRARRHGLGALGVAATLLVAFASTASATTPPDSTTPASTAGGRSAAPADTAGGDAGADLEALVAAAHGGGPGQPHRPARQLGELRRDPAVVPRQVPRHRQPGTNTRCLLRRRAHRRRDAAWLGHDARLDRRRPTVCPASRSRRASGSRTCRRCGTRSRTR